MRSLFFRRAGDVRGETKASPGAHDRCNTAGLRTAFLGRGLEVLGYEGPARYELGQALQCELCGSPVDVTDMGYELRLQDDAEGPRLGYVHQDCLERTTQGRSG